MTRPDDTHMAPTFCSHTCSTLSHMQPFVLTLSAVVCGLVAGVVRAVVDVVVVGVTKIMQEKELNKPENWKLKTQCTHDNTQFLLIR